MPVKRNASPRRRSTAEEGEALFGANRAPLIAPLEEAGGQRGRAASSRSTEGAGRREPGPALGRPARGRASRSKSRRQQRTTSACWRSARARRRTPGCSRSSPPKRPIPPAPWRCSGACAKATGRRSAELEAGRVARRRHGDEAEPLTVPVAGWRRSRSRSRSPAPASRRRSSAQILTVTSEGVWIDGVRDATRTGLDDDVLQARRRSRQRAACSASWCLLPDGAPKARRPASTNCPKRCPAARRAASPGPNPATPKVSANA